jgi:uncharacterized protein DUF5655
LCDRASAAVYAGSLARRRAFSALHSEVGKLSSRALWSCPVCGRGFRRSGQPHGCGRGTKAELLRGKPPALAKLYAALERDLAKWGPQDTLYRGRYAHFRTSRGFADLVFMRDGLRLALYLDRQDAAPCFFKVGRASANRVIHVALLRAITDWRKVRPYLKEAYQLTLEEDALRLSSSSRLRARGTKRSTHGPTAT